MVGNVILTVMKDKQEFAVTEIQYVVDENNVIYPEWPKGFASKTKKSPAPYKLAKFQQEKFSSRVTKRLLDLLRSQPDDFDELDEFDEFDKFEEFDWDLTDDSDYMGVDNDLVPVVAESTERYRREAREIFVQKVHDAQLRELRDQHLGAKIVPPLPQPADEKTAYLEQLRAILRAMANDKLAEQRDDREQ